MGFTKKLRRLKSDIFSRKKNRPKKVRQHSVVDDPDNTTPRDYDADDVGRSTRRLTIGATDTSTWSSAATLTDQDLFLDEANPGDAAVKYSCIYGTTADTASGGRSLPELLAASEAKYSGHDYAGALPLLEEVLITQRAFPSVPPLSDPPAAVYTLKKIGCCQQELGNLQSSVDARLEAAEAWRAYKRLCWDKGGGEEGAGAGVWKGEYDLEIHNAVCRVNFLKKSKAWIEAAGVAKAK